LSERLTQMSAWLTRADWRPESGDSFSRDQMVGHVLRYEHLFRTGEVARECAAAQLRLIWDEVVWSPFYCAVAVPVLSKEAERSTSSEIGEHRVAHG
jgi:hypothetical protein